MNQANAPLPTVKAEFHVEPHPDPVVRALIAEVEALREQNRSLQAQVNLLGRGGKWR